MIGSPANLATSISRGPWWHLFQNRWFEGGRTHRVDAPLEEIPGFLREGAILPLAFDGESKPGATMLSGVNAPHEAVLPGAARPGSTVTYQGFSAVIGPDRLVRPEGLPRDHVLPLTDRSNSITVNGSARLLEMFATTSKELRGARFS